MTVPVASGDTVLTTPNQNGTVTVVLQGSSDLIADNGTTVLFEKLFNGNVTESTKSGKLHFATKATVADSSSQKVSYVDAKNKYFVVENGTSYVKYTAKTIDAFTNESTNGLSLDQFFAALGEGDEVQVSAYGTTATSASHFKISFNKEVKDFDFASKYFVIGNEDAATGAYRVDSNGKFILEGVGQPGYTVYVRPVNGTEYRTTVGSNGNWAVEVNLDKASLTTFEAVQVPAGQKAVYTSAPKLNVLEGAFAIEDVQLVGTTADTLLGKTIQFNDTTVSLNDSFVVKSGATITLVDEDGTKVKYTHGVNATFSVDSANPSQASIAITGAYTQVATGSIAGFGKAFSVDSITGFQNKYGLVAKPVNAVLSK